MKIATIEVELLGHYGSDLEVVNAARVSMHKRSELEYETRVRTKHDVDMANAFHGTPLDYSRVGETYTVGEGKLSHKDEKLIKYLAVHNHHSPFNHAFMSFRVKAPIFVARQLVKHKFLPWNEVSRRYVDEEPEFFFPDYWRKKAENVKQGSSDDAAYMMVDLNGEDWLVGDVMKDFSKDCLFIYTNAINAGVCPEQARMVLPQNTMTEWVWSGTLGAFLDMLVLRLDSHTQRETQEVAKKIAAYVKNLFPVSYGAYIHEANS